MEERAEYHVSEKATRYLTEQDRVIAFKRIYVDVMGDVVGALWLSQLAYWQPLAKRSDGFVYKSRDDWERETGLTKSQIKRVADKAENMGIVEIKLKRASGAPTLHYRINHTELNKVINSIIRKVDFQESGKSDLQESGKSDLQESGKSLTETTQETTQKTNSANAETRENANAALSAMRASTQESLSKKKADTSEYVPPIDWQIGADKEVTAANIAASAGDTVTSRLADWYTLTSDEVIAVCRAVAENFNLLPPATPRGKAQGGANQFFYAWKSGAETLLSLGSAGDVVQAIKAVAFDYDGGYTVAGPSSLKNKVYAELSKPKAATPDYHLDDEGMLKLT